MGMGGGGGLGEASKTHTWTSSTAAAAAAALHYSSSLAACPTGLATTSVVVTGGCSSLVWLSSQSPGRACTRRATQRK